MVKHILIGLITWSLLAVLLAACTIEDTSSQTNPTVHMGATDFLQHSITIHKGDKLTLIDDTTSPHIITNGSWVNGVAKPYREPGAPAVNVSFSGNDSATIGPFNTAGTFHLYCTIHQNMQLTVIVT